MFPELAQGAAQAAQDGASAAEQVGVVVGIIVGIVTVIGGLASLGVLIKRGLRDHGDERRLIERLDRYFPDPDDAAEETLRTSVPARLNLLELAVGRNGERLGVAEEELKGLADDLRQHMVEETERLAALERRNAENAEAARKARRDFELEVYRRINAIRVELLAAVAAVTGVVPQLRPHAHDDGIDPADPHQPPTEEDHHDRPPG